jgi:hypothetical protein
MDVTVDHVLVFVEDQHGPLPLLNEVVGEGSDVGVTAR